MAEILHFEILRKHGQTHRQTDRQTDRHGHYNTSPSPSGGEVNMTNVYASTCTRENTVKSSDASSEGIRNIYIYRYIYI